MRNSIAIFDINAKDGVMARASFRKDNPEKVLAQKFQAAANEPTQCSLMSMLSYCLDIIRTAAEKDPSLKGRYTFLVPESIAYRLFQAQKCVNNGDDIVSELVLPWMTKDDRYMITDTIIENGKNVEKTFNAWVSAITELSGYLYEMMDKKTDWSLNIVNSRSIYRWECHQESLEDDDTTPRITNGMKAHFDNGIDKDLRLYCTENNFLTGDFTITENDIRDREGNVTKHYYVPRYIAVTNTRDNTRMNMTVTEFIDANDDMLEPTFESGALLVNAAKLRMETTKLLPRVLVAKKMKASDVLPGQEDKVAALF